jgi:hypothetical protein
MDAIDWHFQSAKEPGMARLVRELRSVLIGKSFRRRNAIDVILSIPDEKFNQFRTSMAADDGNKADYLENELEDAFKAIWPEIDVATFQLVIEYPPTEADDEAEENDAIMSTEEVSRDARNGFPADQVGLNSCWFTTDTTVSHDRLRFRSKSEIAIYDELKNRKLLFFPNPAAVIGGATNQKKEPDFLICSAGNWGILEVMGSYFHTKDNAVKDHDRARLFKDFGILCIEFFDASECSKNPANVVDKFLAILAKH